MLNRDVYLTDPSQRKLVNEGVANVNDDTSAPAMKVLRYELETFVCDGQYQKGLEHVLHTYLANINRDAAHQPGVWVSGFYGSGKSHLIKMLRALWVDTPFADGATARGIAHLPTSISDQLKELSVEGKRHGGLHAASGTLGAGASGSVRLALLRIVFKSVGLPQSYPVARFVMWLKKEGIFDDVRQQVEGSGYDWEEELDNFHVAEGLYTTLRQIKPTIFSSNVSAADILPKLYPNVPDVGNDEMIKAIRQALMSEGKFPLTLIVLDEVQQYIGEDSDRSRDVQEAVEACCKNIGGKLLFIGTGQTAVTETSNLKKLEGRFTVRIQLSDTDVDTVVRQVILAKKPAAIAPIEQMMETNLGEISRHLTGTTLGHRQDDIPYFAKDYPILPVRRRFWESALRALDPTGTDSQLRNQLSMIHKVIQTNLDQPLGHVVPADYLYFDAADRLLQSRILPRKVHEKTLQWWNQGTDPEKLLARACGLVFLVNKLAGHNKEIGLKATAETIADLMVDDLANGSSTLRHQLPQLLDKCKLLMKVQDEYRIQTEESAAWTDEFMSHRAHLANEAHQIDAERDRRIRAKFAEVTKKLLLTQGKSKVQREIQSVFDAQLPPDHARHIYVWVRDGWSVDENSVRVDARQAGNHSPTVFVHIPRRSADELRHHLIEFKSAGATLEIRGVANTAEGQEARSAMETTQKSAENRINHLLNEAFQQARVFQGGGQEISGTQLGDMVAEAAGHALQRLYPQFHLADDPGWAKVYEKAQRGAADALKAVGFDGEPAKNPVCKAILGFIAGGKKGADIRAHFEAAEFGWPRDAIDGGLQVLLVAGLIRAEDGDSHQPLAATELERKAIGKALFKVESATVTTKQYLEIRKLLNKVGLKSTKPEEDRARVPEFLDTMLALAQQAGGEPPRPAPPDTSALTDIRLTAGNEQLLAIYNAREDLRQDFEHWTDLAHRITQRWPVWEQATRLLAHARELPEAEAMAAHARQIEEQRQLLAEPDPLQPLVQNLTQLLRNRLNELKEKYDHKYDQGIKRLKEDANWQQLDADQRGNLMAEQKLMEHDRPEIRVQTPADVLATLNQLPLIGLADRVAALPARFDNVASGAARMCEPQAQFIQVPRRTLKSAEEIDAWADDVKQQLKAALKQGPVVVR